MKGVSAASASTSRSKIHSRSEVLTKYILVLQEIKIGVFASCKPRSQHPLNLFLSLVFLGSTSSRVVLVPTGWLGGYSPSAQRHVYSG